MDCAEFYQWVRDTLNRGSTLDNVIPLYIKSAVREIENKRNFQQLEWWASFPLTTADEPIISLPDRLKEPEFIRYNIAPANKRPEWVYLSRFHAIQTISRVGMPRRYWINERKLAVLDAQLEKDLDFEIKAYRYSEFPDENAAADVQHWLLDAIPTGLHSKVMLGLAGYMREDDKGIVQNWQALYKEAIFDLVQEDDFSKEAGKAPVMEYWPEHIPFTQAFQDTEE